MYNPSGFIALWTRLIWNINLESIYRFDTLMISVISIERAPLTHNTPPSRDAYKPESRRNIYLVSTEPQLLPSLVYTCFCTEN